MKILYRLSIIFWTPIILIVALFYLPFRWVITGNYFLEPFEIRWLFEWTLKIFKQ